MRALSIRQPYAFLIAHGYKLIENRTWTTEYRGPLLIHASKQIDPSFPLASHWPETMPQCWREVITRIPQDERYFPRGGIVGMATLVEIVTSSSNPWFEGPYGFVLHDARPLPFVPMRGALHLFEVERRGHI